MIISRLFHESVKAIRQHEATLVSEIIEAIDSDLLAQWKRTITQPREDGATVQSWLWAAPAKHSTRQIDRVLEDRAADLAQGRSAFS